MPNGRKAQDIVEVRSGRASKTKAVKISDTTLIRLRMLALQAQIAEQDPSVGEAEIIRRLVEREVA